MPNNSYSLLEDFTYIKLTSQKNQRDFTYCHERLSYQKDHFNCPFLAWGVILPFVTENIPQIGKKLLPLHIPVFLYRFICGCSYGMLLGVLTPLLRSILFGQPVFYQWALQWHLNLEYMVAFPVYYIIFIIKKLGIPIYH